MRLVVEAAGRLGLRTRPRGFASGRTSGGKPFARGHIHQILTNPIYAGCIRHHKQVYGGQHAALIDPKRWQQVQDLLQGEAARVRGATNAAAPQPLIGKLFDDTGDGPPPSYTPPSHTTKKGTRLRYYISRRLISGCAKDHPDAWRLPAAPLETGLADIIYRPLTDPTTLPAIAPNLGAADLTRLQAGFKGALKPLQSPQAMPLLASLLERAELGSASIKISLAPKALADLLGAGPKRLNLDALTFSRPFQRRRRGVETKLILGAQPAARDATLLGNIRKARHWYAQVIEGNNFSQIATEEGFQRSRVQNMISLAFIAPDILEMIIAGTQPPALTTQWFKTNDLPLDWADQRKAIAALK